MSASDRAPPLVGSADWPRLSVQTGSYLLPTLGSEIQPLQTKLGLLCLHNVASAAHLRWPQSNNGIFNLSFNDNHRNTKVEMRRRTVGWRGNDIKRAALDRSERREDEEVGGGGGEVRARQEGESEAGKWEVEDTAGGAWRIAERMEAEINEGEKKEEKWWGGKRLGHQGWRTDE